MKPPVFEYERPPNVRAALEALSKHGGKAKLLAGGHSLIPQLNLRAISPGRLIDIGRLDRAAVHHRRLWPAPHRRLDHPQHDLSVGGRRQRLPDHDRGLSARRQSFDPQPWNARRQSLPQRSGLRAAAGDRAARRKHARAQRALPAYDRGGPVLQGAVRDRLGARRDAGRDPRSSAARPATAMRSWRSASVSAIAR